MRFLIHLSLLSLHLLHTHALTPRGIILPKVDPEPIEPVDPVRDPAPETPDDTPSDNVPSCNTDADCSNDPTAPSTNDPIYIAPSSTNPDPAAEDSSEIAEHISDILDLVTSIISIAQGGSTVTASASLPTAAYPCLSAQDLYASCASVSSDFGVQAATAQANCLCYDEVRFDVNYNPGAFDGYISSCNQFVLEQSSISTQASYLSPALGLCSSVGVVRAGATGTVVGTGTGTGVAASATGSGTGVVASPGSGSGSATTTASVTGSSSTPTIQPASSSGASRRTVWGLLLVPLGIVWKGMML